MKEKSNFKEDFAEACRLLIVAMKKTIELMDIIYNNSTYPKQHPFKKYFKR